MSCSVVLWPGSAALKQNLRCWFSLLFHKVLLWSGPDTDLSWTSVLHANKFSQKWQVTDCKAEEFTPLIKIDKVNKKEVDEVNFYDFDRVETKWENSIRLVWHHWGREERFIGVERHHTRQACQITETHLGWERCLHFKLRGAGKQGKWKD